MYCKNCGKPLDPQAAVCVNCGCAVDGHTPLTNNEAKFCRNCGKPVDPNAAICVNCGCAPGTGASFCANCGNHLDPNATFCVQCGSAVRPLAPPPRPSGVFCRNCGRPMDIHAAICVSCGCMAGSGTSFCPHCGRPTGPNAAVCTSCGRALSNSSNGSKSKMTAGLLGIFLGGVGAHDFYLGNTVKAIIHVILFLVGFFTITADYDVYLFLIMLILGSSIWGLIDGIMILTGKISKDARGIPLKD